MGEFRDDLFYRLNVLSIYLPPLRERRDDIPLLVKRFVREFTAQHERKFPGIAADAMQRLIQAPWPGNVRQLRNLIESMVVLAPAHEIRAHDIPADVMEGAGTLLPMRIAQSQFDSRNIGGPEFEFILRSLMELRSQLEDLRRRIDDRNDVQVIEVSDPDAPIALADLARRRHRRRGGRAGTRAGGALPARDDDGRHRAEGDRDRAHRARRQSPQGGAGAGDRRAHAVPEAQGVRAGLSTLATRNPIIMSR